MVLLFYTTYISVELAHYEVFRATGGIKMYGRKGLFCRN